MQKSSNIETLDSSKISKIGQARKNLRQRQLFIIIFIGGVSFIFILLAGAVVPMSWEWIVYATAIPETCGHILVEFIFNRGRFASKSTTRTTNNNNQEDQLDSTVNTDMRGSDQIITPQPSATSGRVGKTKVSVYKSKFANRRPWKAALSMITEERTVATSAQSTSRNTHIQSTQADT